MGNKISVYDLYRMKKDKKGTLYTIVHIAEDRHLHLPIEKLKKGELVVLYTNYKRVLFHKVGCEELFSLHMTTTIRETK